MKKRTTALAPLVLVGVLLGSSGSALAGNPSGGSHASSAASTRGLRRFSPARVLRRPARSAETQHFDHTLARVSNRPSLFHPFRGRGETPAPLPPAAAEAQYLMVPGLFAQHLGHPMGRAMQRLKSLGQTVHVAGEGDTVGSFDADAPVLDNTDALIGLVDQLYETSHQPVVLVPHSSGGVSVVEMFDRRPDLAGKIAGVAFIETTYRGSYVADAADRLVRRPMQALSRVLTPRGRAWVGKALRAIHDVTTPVRADAVAARPFRGEVPAISVGGQSMRGLLQADGFNRTSSELIDHTIQVRAVMSHRQGSFGKRSANVIEAAIRELFENVAPRGPQR